MEDVLLKSGIIPLLHLNFAKFDFFSFSPGLSIDIELLFLVGSKLVPDQLLNVIITVLVHIRDFRLQAAWGTGR